MALKAIVSTLDGLPADVAKEYAKRDDGTFILSVIAVDDFDLQNIKGLRGGLEQEREVSRKLKDKLKGLDGVEPAILADAIKRLDEIKNFNPDQKVAEGMKLREAQIIDIHKKELEKRDSRAAILQREIERVLVDEVITAAVVEAGGKIKFLKPHIKEQVRVREQDGTFITEVVDSKGTPRIGGKNGEAMTVAQLVSEFKETPDWAPAFQSSGASGSGQKGGNNGTPTPSGGKKTATRAELADGRVDPVAMAKGLVEIVD